MINCFFIRPQEKKKESFHTAFLNYLNTDQTIFEPEKDFPTGSSEYQKNR